MSLDARRSPFFQALLASQDAPQVPDSPSWPRASTGWGAMRCTVLALAAAAVLVVGLGSAWWVSHSMRQQTLERAMARQADEVDTVARMLASRLEQQQRLLWVLSQGMADQGGDPSRLMGEMLRGDASVRLFDTLQLADARGQLQLSLRGGLVGWSDGVRQMAVRARLDSLVRPPSPDFPYGMRVGLTGRIAKATVEAQGLIGPVLDLQSEQARFPVKLWAHAGSLRARAEGILDNPRALKGMDLQVHLRGSSMADLFPLTGLLLPRTPPFDTNGHLVGSLQPGRAEWDYENFEGRVGQSDLRGSLHYASGKPRPKLSGELASRKLRLADLGPVVGAPSTRQDQKSRQAASGKTLPTQRFDTSKWNAMDMDVHFQSDRIERPQALPIENFSVHAVMDNGVLRLAPLRFGMAKGKLDLQAMVDSGAKPPKANLQGKVQGLQLSALFPEIELMKKSLGSMDGAIALEGRGQSMAEWLGTSSGDMRLYVRDGRFSKQLLDLAALNLGSVVVTKLFGADKEVQLNCAVADLSVQNGLARTRNVKLATPEAIVEATGQISLAQETMDLHIKPESLKWKFFSLRTPLYVRGSFANPKVGVEPGPLLLRAGAAVAAAVVAPAALALVPLTVPAAEEDAQCQRLLADAGKK